MPRLEFGKPVWRVLVAPLVAVFWAQTVAADEPASPDWFERRIRPVLLNSCVRCHGQQTQQGSLRLDTRDSLLAGGDSGPAIVAGNAEASLLVQALKRAEGGPQMPPAAPVAPQVIDDFEKWIAAGAVWPESQPALPAHGHWAFEPIVSAEENPIPPLTQPTTLAAFNPVDAFIDHARQAHNLTGTPAANRQTLARRLAFDLTGLPPTPAQVEAYLNDAEPDAHERLVDRLLHSPQYGEKWGRFWLDVVRYADTAGETADFPVHAAWRYRNYVIDAWNADKPYNDFLQEQLAGDLLASANAADISPERYAELVTATGYIAISRRFGFDSVKDHFLTLDDTVDTLGKSILGLTIGCARCHDHKYEPISTRDYYGLYGIFASTQYAFPGSELDKQPRQMVPLCTPNKMEQIQQSFEMPLAQLDAQIADLNRQAQESTARLTALASGNSQRLASGSLEDGQSSLIDPAAAPAIERVHVEPGQVLQLSIGQRGNHGGDTTLVEWKIEELAGEKRVWRATEDALAHFTESNPHADAYGHDRTWGYLDLRGGLNFLPQQITNLDQHAGLHVWRNGDTPSALITQGNEPVEAWSKLPARSLFVHPAADGPVAIIWVSPISGDVRITGNVQDAHQGGADGVDWNLDHLPGPFAETLATLANVQEQVRALQARRQALADNRPLVPVAYAVQEGEIKDVQIQLRGDPLSLGEVAPRKNLDLLGGQRVDSPATSGRLQLAQWLCDAENPLTARVIVNRIWQQHFGRGIVRTPNDFGTRGEAPSHPQLLDHLAHHFVEQGWSLKKLQRQLVLSAVYRQASSFDAALAEQDPGNIWLWRFERRRLAAEEIRDAILACCGTMDSAKGAGHPFPDSSSWQFTQHNPFAAVYDNNLRSVYQMTQRIKRHPFFGLFDGADTAASTGQRFSTIVPTQALFFMNDPFVHEQADRLAERVLAQATTGKDAIAGLYPMLLGRQATEDDLTQALEFMRLYAEDTANPSAQTPESAQPTVPTAASVSAWARVLLCSNEFLYVD